MAYVGDSDRERTAGALRRHYVEGRLTEAELSSRLDQALRARTRIDLLLAARSLPGHSPLRELFEPHARAAARTARRALLLVALAAAWVAATLVFAGVFLVTVLVEGATAEVLLGFPLVWALLTWALWHAARRRPA
jgi:fatty acid desaturase